MGTHPISELTVGVTLLQTSKHDWVQFINFAMQSCSIQPLFMDDCLCGHLVKMEESMRLGNGPQYLEQTSTSLMSMLSCNWWSAPVQLHVQASQQASWELVNGRIQLLVFCI